MVGGAMSKVADLVMVLLLSFAFVIMHDVVESLACNAWNKIWAPRSLKIP